MLRVTPDVDVIDQDIGYREIAELFGYDMEHHASSRRVGERRLVSSVRQAHPDVVIVAPGFSCRLQITQFTGRKSLHPAELLRSFLS